MINTPARSRPRIVPDAYVVLSNWRYLEQSILRILAGWGRCAGDWEDKLAVCHHVWLQAEIVQRMRTRLEMFPGGKAESPNARVFEEICNAVLLAPSYADAMAGVYGILNPLLVSTYSNYISASHRVHDLPTHDILRETLAIKSTQAKWYDDFCRRHMHFVDQAYQRKIQDLIGSIGGFAAVIEPSSPAAEPCGRNTSFRMPLAPGRPKGWNESPEVMPFLQRDWGHSVETRRLFFIIGYMREMGVAEEQLRWIYHADFMPWEYIYEESRHMWDESRHGDSGLHRLHDFGLDLCHVRYDSYGAAGGGMLEPMTPRELCERFHFITQIAETGYFETKRYCFEDFDHGRDDASAEMMQFDIIDETSHVAYGHKWLPELIQHAQIDPDYRARGREDRAMSQRNSDLRVKALRQFTQTRQIPHSLVAAASPTEAATLQEHFRILADPKIEAHYLWLLRELREKLPLKNIDEAPARPNLPM